MHHARHRPIYDPWAVTLDLAIDSRVIAASDMVKLVGYAGLVSGIGEWRPSAPMPRSGPYGRFEVVSSKRLGTGWGDWSFYKGNAMATKAKAAASVNGTGHGARIEVPAVSPPVQTIHIPAPNIIRLRLRLRGLSPLIVCRMDEKVMQGIEDAMGGKAKLKKAPKDPEAEWNAARYVSSDGKWDGVHAGCFRGAIIAAARSVESLTMTALKQAIFIKADGYAKGRGEPLVRIHGEGKKFTNICRTQTGVSYPRHRPMYDPWSVVLNIEANGHLLSTENLVNLVACAGQFCGIGEWRPTAPKSFTGTMGRFEVINETEE